MTHYSKKEAKFFVAISSLVNNEDNQSNESVDNIKVDSLDANKILVKKETGFSTGVLEKEKEQSKLSALENYEIAIVKCDEDSKTSLISH